MKSVGIALLSPSTDTSVGTTTGLLVTTTKFRGFRRNSRFSSPTLLLAFCMALHGRKCTAVAELGPYSILATLCFICVSGLKGQHQKLIFVV